VGGLSTQAELRSAFTQWGLPRRIRVDNGVPWGSDDGLPTELECWLTGLGVTLVLNPPYRPQKNGVVERSQGIAKQWTEPYTCATAEELQTRLDLMDRRQREQYPHGPTGRPRLQVHPTLMHSGRTYKPDDEAEQWSIDPVKTTWQGT
jgi:transposase InsO family protein